MSELRQRKNRNQLFDNVSETNLKASSADDDAKAVTTSYLRTKAMIQQELHRVHNVTNVIDQDGKILKDTSRTHKGLGSMVKNARKTLGVLKRQDVQEALVFWAALVFFYLSALYVFWTRMRIPFLLW